MKTIRPVSDLRNNCAEISQQVHETGKPIFLTKNGFGDMVVLSMEAYESMAFESEVYEKLKEAEQIAETNDVSYSTKQVLDMMKKRINEEL
ncbi:type II toxin-antitoxin system Phd/YefM family antitoxin [Aliicoccus persicus]|uniref:Antitoxin n=1 Tax=Aliicoccus persicus TaxID=930138 RepID=A0A662Z4W3_9STAP|nr:type II toxin-antitoxin system Phd/YefM family antitoxin [Aliicoccus persicus]SEW14231.1 prevent-host-death family protein [Aliicoccus persicus]